MSTYQAESFYRGTIRQSIASNTSVPFTLKVSKIPTLTTWLLTISPQSASEEVIEYSGVDAVALTITVIKRWIKPSTQALTLDGTDYNNTSFQFAHSQNDAIRWDVNHLHISWFAWISENNIFTWNNIFSSSMRLPVYADATARDAGIPSPSNGMMVYNTALGIIQQYVGATWTDMASWTTVNASNTVAGKVEIATNAEFISWTGIWWTGASLVFTPEQLITSYYFWDWSDGDVTISTNTTLTRDMYYNNLTVNTWIELNPAWFAIYVLWTLTLTGTAKITRLWNNGGNASWTTAGTAWVALATWTCWPCSWWAVWWAASTGWNGGAWGNGVSVNPSYASLWARWGWAWWDSTWWVFGWSGWAWWTSTQWSLYNKIYSLQIALQRVMMPSRLLSSFIQYGSAWSCWAWGWGAASWWATSWAWGWSGWCGGIILIFANILAGTGTIEAKWGTWGNWWNATVGNAGGWGGWSGWSGGIVFLTYRTGTPFTTVLTWWTWGTWWAKIGTWVAWISWATWFDGLSINIII